MLRARFTKRARLLKPAEFTRVFDTSTRSRDRYFTVLAKPSDLVYPRLGLAISKKSAKYAVARNRIKRIIRESFRRHQQNLHGVDFVVLAKPEAAVTNNELLFSSLEKHWIRLSKLCGHF